MTDRHAAVAVALFERLFADSPGVTGFEASVINAAGVIEVVGTAWSPTLHAQPTLWTLNPHHLAADLAPGRDLSLAIMRRDADVLQSLVDRIRPFNVPADIAASVDRQTRRQRKAATLGIARPPAMPHPSESTPELLAEIPLDHVMIDRHLCVLQGRELRRRGRASTMHAVKAELVEHLLDIHQRQTVCDDVVDSDAIRIVDAGHAHIVHAMLPAGGGTSLYDGLVLHMAADLPETVLAHAVGMPLGRVVDTQSALADRTIMSADRAASTTPGATSRLLKFALSTDHVPLARVDALADPGLAA